MISGMRKAPPISISSPRETTASRPPASVLSTSSTAAALLLTTVASSAPVSSHSRSAHHGRRVRRACRRARSNSSATAFAHCGIAAASIAASASSARPRLVCSTVPVRLKTGRSDERSSASRIDSAVAAISPGPTETDAPPDSSTRAACRARRMASVAAFLPNRESRTLAVGASRTVATEGRPRRRPDVVPSLRVSGRASAAKGSGWGGVV